MPFPIKVYTHHHGNYFGNFTFVWKIDIQSHGERDLEAIDIIRQDLPVFSTRAMRREFINRYSNVSPSFKPAVLRDVYRFLTQDASAAESKNQSEVDERVEQFLVTADEPGLFYDLRKQNGRPVDEKLNPFWDELKKYLEEITVVHERRQTQHMYMPFALSIQDLINTINQRLEPGSKSPSVSWVRLNFWPMNSYTRTALCYTGRFDVKYSVQQRLLRSKHPDSEFAFHQFRLMKEMAVNLRDKSDFICLDDKAVVPIGEPGNPVSSGVRPNQQALVPTGARLVALDHDFHLHGAIPSVLFHVDIPEQSSDSFYNGRLHVTVKDKVFQPSPAMCHTTESVSILRSVACADGINLTNPILFIYTDGGPDHRCTYFSVQLALIALFLALDLDMLVAVRTAPCQSYNNPAERCMSILNMGLQHCSLQRERMSDGMELRVKSLSSLKKIREKSDREPAIKENLIESIEPVIAKLKQRFSKLRFHNDSTIVHDAATDEQIGNILELLEIFKDENQDDDKKVFSSLKTKKDLQKYDKLKDFYEHHCRERQYTFQVKKCRSECWYCYINGWRLPDDERETLHWLPDPTLEDNKYLPFTELYGKRQTSDNDRPGLEAQKVTKEVDKENTGILVAGRVRGFIMCVECGKRRCVYSKQRLGRDAVSGLERVQEELVYLCGNALFPHDHKLVKEVLVRESLTCASSTEVTYYAAVREKFADICFYCGDLEVVVTDMIRELRTKYGIVRPICQTCLDNGKLPATRSALKVGQKRKQ